MRQKREPSFPLAVSVHPPTVIPPPPSPLKTMEYPSYIKIGRLFNKRTFQLNPQTQRGQNINIRPAPRCSRKRGKGQKKGGGNFQKRKKERAPENKAGWLAGDCKTIYASSLLATARVTKRNAGLQHHHHHFRTAHGKGQTLPSARLLPYG